MSKHYKLYTDNEKYFITNDEALVLEMRLNKSEYGRVWSLLGDTLYNWRLDPTKYQVSGNMQYKVSDYLYNVLRSKNA